MPLLAAAGSAAFVVLVVMIGTLGAFIPAFRSGPGPAMDAGLLGCPPALTRAGGSSNGKDVSDIPPTYLALYQAAGAKYGVAWSVLAGIGKAESDHGRGPGSGIRSGTNYAGAAGPMQFLLSTWKGYATDGDDNGTKNVYDPRDAIPAAALYLRRNGAPAHIEKAVSAYNHSPAYVRQVLATAASYAKQGPVPSCEMPFAGPASGRAAVAVKAALRWLGTPYSWGGGSLTGPSRGFGRGAGTIGFDCSSLVRYAWHQAGITLPRVAADQWQTLRPVPRNQITAGDLVFFKGALGTMSKPGHVGMILDNRRMIEAPHTGAQVRIREWTIRGDVVGFGRPGAR
ncbi:C40 family peptidase [Actinocorallia longicatena]|uniref:NlpC/P60 family protein n=1 Tax=Actinocorallia longicatena TaxID=111803 RepID=A0ABP6QQT0_9ACTN